MFKQELYNDALVRRAFVVPQYDSNKHVVLVYSSNSTDGSVTVYTCSCPKGVLRISFVSSCGKAWLQATMQVLCGLHYTAWGRREGRCTRPSSDSCRYAAGSQPQFARLQLCCWPGWKSELASSIRRHWFGTSCWDTPNEDLLQERAGSVALPAFAGTQTLDQFQDAQRVLATEISTKFIADGESVSTRAVKQQLFTRNTRRVAQGFCTPQRVSGNFGEASLRKKGHVNDDLVRVALGIRCVKCQSSLTPKQQDCLRYQKCCHFSTCTRTWTRPNCFPYRALSSLWRGR